MIELRGSWETGFGWFAALGLVTGLLLTASGVAVAEESPRRVVSVNLCTDQLAMLVAGQGQLHSVSHLTIDPQNSVLAQEARSYVVNHGRAEEIFLMEPDLVLAGTFSNRSAVALLRRLGFRVEEFDPENSIEDIRRNVLRMGELLGRQERAAELVAEFDLELATLLRSSRPSEVVPRAALLFPNGYTFGEGTLLDELVETAGLENATAALARDGVGRLPLELLVLSAPDLLITGDLGGTAPALANEALRHPALAPLVGSTQRVELDDRYWVCGAPFTMETLRTLSQARAEFISARKVPGR